MSRRRWTRGLELTLSAAFLGVLACAPREPSPEEPLNVILLTVDTLRPDRLSAYGHPRPVSPHLDRFARGALLFENARSQGAWTLPSYATLLTSRYPSRHGAVWIRHKLSLDELSLAEVLRDEGYETHAFVNNGLLGPSRNLGQGFDEYDFVSSKPREIRGAAETAEQIVEWLETRLESPFFLFVNLMDPHSVYFPSAVSRERFDPAYEGPFRDAFPEFEVPEEFRKPPGGEIVPILTEDVRRHARALYDAEIHDVDRGVRTLLRALDELGLLETSIVMFSSDHGEELWEHRGFGHGHSVHEEILRVPLVVWMPERAGSRWARARTGIDETRIGLIDVAPTILDVLGLDLPASFEGSSFAAEPLAPERPPGGQLAEATLHDGERKAYTEDGWKLVFDVFLGRRSLYHLPTDPAERNDLADAEPEKVGELLAKLVTVARVPRGGWRVAGRGGEDTAIIRGRVETTGRIVSAVPHDLEAFQNTRRDRQKLRDVWSIEDGGSALEFTFRVDSDVDGLAIFVDPPTAETIWSVTIDDEADSRRVQLGADARTPETVPFRVSPHSIRCPLLEPPRQWQQGAAAALAIWTVEGETAEWDHEEIDLDEATLENLRALGYVD